MKTTYTKRILAMLLSLVVMLSMCLAGTVSAFADSGGAIKMAVEPTAAGTAEADSEAAISMNTPLSGGVGTNNSTPVGSTIEAENMNTSVGTGYVTPEIASSSTYKIHMPVAGALELSYKAASGSVYASVSAGGSALYNYSSTTVNGVTVRRYPIVSAGYVNVTFNPSDRTVVGFVARYAPKTIGTVKAPSGDISKTYYLGGQGNNSTVSTFKVSVPAKGKLALYLGDANGSYSVYMKTSGFSNYEYVSTSDVRRTIGVKKGTYTFYVKSYAPIYAYRVKFTKVSESKYGSKKSTAASMKKKSKKKGLIITNSKKTHWYKFKNPKLQKVKLVITTSINGGGNYSGGIKVTIYDRRGTSTSRIIYPDTASITLKLYNRGTKLTKGTYKVKIQSYKSGNGYFSVKWK